MNRLLIVATMLAWGVAFCSQIARSDDAVPDPVNEHCKHVANTFYAGEIGRIDGYARQMKGVTEMELAMLEHRIPFKFSKEAMPVIGWDLMEKEQRDGTELHAFAGWDTADHALKAGAAFDDKAAEITGHLYYQMCEDGRKAPAADAVPEASPEPDPAPGEGTFKRMKGQKFECENTLGFAADVAQQLTEHPNQILSAINPRFDRTIKDVKWCRAAKQPLRECVLRRCMGSDT